MCPNPVVKRKRLKLDDIPKYEALVNALKRAQKKWKKRPRDLALVAALVFTGARISEIIELKLGSIDFEHRTVTITQLKKRGMFKRIIPIPSNLFWQIIRNYVNTLPFVNSEEKLFSISVRQARNIVYEFSERFLGRRIRPHAIRHSYAVFVLKNTRDLEAVRRLLGHSDYKWLKQYLDYTQEDLKTRLEEAFTSLEL